MRKPLRLVREPDGPWRQLDDGSEQRRVDGVLAVGPRLQNQARREGRLVFQALTRAAAKLGNGAGYFGLRPGGFTGQIHSAGRLGHDAGR